MGDLIGVLNQFFSRLGLPTLRFKPAYNPYTEPSMEIFSYSEQLKKWMEVRLVLPSPSLLSSEAPINSLALLLNAGIPMCTMKQVGNSGMFRPEMLRPMGMPEDVNVIAWGLSLERPTMILYGIDNIRDLFGHKVWGGSW